MNKTTIPDSWLPESSERRRFLQWLGVIVGSAIVANAAACSKIVDGPTLEKNIPFDLSQTRWPYATSIHNTYTNLVTLASALSEKMGPNQHREFKTSDGVYELHRIRHNDFSFTFTPSDGAIVQYTFSQSKMTIISNTDSSLGELDRHLWDTEKVLLQNHKRAR